MVDVNTKLMVFVIMIDVFLLAMFSLMPPSMSAQFSGVKTIGANYSESLPSDNLNGTKVSQTEFLVGGWSGAWSFIQFMVLGGLLTVSSIPIWFSILVVGLFWVMNILVLLDLIGYVRELIGFT